MFDAQVAGPRYDAVLHVVFVGIVTSMIFGHAPINFSAILGVPNNLQPAFYIHLILLHVSLALRVIADDANLNTLRMWGGLLNEVAVLLFIGITIFFNTKKPDVESIAVTEVLRGDNTHQRHRRGRGFAR